MVMTQVGYFFRMPALVLSACWPVPSTSKLSSGKKTGWNGEFLLMASRSPPSGSLVMPGSGGIGVVSGTGSGGAGGRFGVGAVPPAVLGGAIGRATGGLLLWQAPTSVKAAIITIAGTR